jgi:hypothetical protein
LVIGTVPVAGTKGASSPWLAPGFGSLAPFEQALAATVAVARRMNVINTRI